MVEYDIGEPYAIQSPTDENISYQFQKAPDTANIPYSYVPGNLQVFGSTGFAVDAGYRVDDNQVGSQILWSSAKTADRTDHRGQRGNLATYDGKGRLVDGGASVDSITNTVLNNINSEYVNEMIDTAVNVATSRATAECFTRVQPAINAQVSSLIGNKLDIVPVYTTTNIPIFSTTGQLQDSNISIDQLVDNINTLQASVAGTDEAAQAAVEAQVDAMRIQLKAEQDLALAGVASSINDKIAQTNTTLNATIAAGDQSLRDSIALTNSSLNDQMALNDQLVRNDMNALINAKTTELQVADAELQQDISALNDDINQLSSSKMNIVYPAASGNIPVLDAMGQLTDSQLTIQQFQTCASQIQSVLASQQAVEDQLASTMMLVPGAAPGNTAIFDANGQAVDSGVSLAQLSASIQQLTTDVGESLFVPMQTSPNNLPIFDVNGQLVDSKVNVTSLMPKVIGGTANNLTMLDANGQLVDSTYRVDDTIVSPTNLWTSAVTSAELDEKVNRPQLFTTGNLAVFDNDGHVIDGGPVPALVLPFKPPVQATPVVTMDAYGMPIESNVTVQDLQVKRVPAFADNVALLDANGFLQDSGYGIDDTLAASPTVLWSSEKVQQLDNTKLDRPALFSTNNFPMFDAQGQLVDSQINADYLSQQVEGAMPKVMNITEPNRVAVFSTNGTVTDSGVDITKLQQLVVPISSNNLASLDASGKLVESGIMMDDTLVGPNVFWSSDRTSADLAMKIDVVDPFSQGNIPVFDANGQLVDGGLAPQAIIDTALDLCRTETTTRVTKVANATEGAIAVLTADGQISDSMVLVSNLQTKVSPSTDGNLVSLVNGQVVDSMYRVDDTLIDPQVVWTSQKTNSLLAQKLSTPISYGEGFIPVFDATGQLVDSRTTPASLMATMDQKITDKCVLSQPTATGLAVWDSVGQQTGSGIQVQQLMLRDPMAQSGQLAVYDTAGQTMGSQYRVDDSTVPDSSVLYTSLKTTTLIDSVAASKLTKPSGAVPGEIPMFDVSGELMSSGMSASTVISQLQAAAVPKQPLVIPTQPNAISVLGADGVLVDSGRTLNDFLLKPASSTLNHIATYDQFGQLQDNGLMVNDSNTVSTSTLWSSSHTASELDARMRALTTYSAGNVPIIGSDGHVVDSNVSLTKLTPPVPSAENNMCMLSADGRLLDSGVRRDQLLTTPITYTAGHLPTFDSTGNLLDSLYSIDDSQPPSSQIVYSSVKTTQLVNDIVNTSYQKLQKSAVAGNLAVWNPDGQTVDSMFKVDDAAAPAPLVLYSSSKIDSLLKNVGTISIAGTATIVGCVNESWITCSLTACTPLGASLLSSDGLAVKVPRAGCYKFSFFIFEKSKNSSSGYAIERRSSSTIPYQLTTNVLPVKSINEMSRLFTLTAGEEIVFRTWQRDNCANVDLMEWCMEELSQS